MHRTSFVVLFLTMLLPMSLSSLAIAQTDAFTYQGSLVDSGGMADGQYDFQFRLFPTISGGSALGTDEHLNVQVLDGLFMVDLEFGSTAFTSGADRFLEVSVRIDGEPNYTTLDPRVRLDSVPFAAHADAADVADYALSGPFEPVDTTPTSTSGTPPQSISYSLIIDGDHFPQSFEVEFPIRIQRGIEFTFSGYAPSLFSDFQIRLTKPLNSNDDWLDLFKQATPRITVIIDVTSSTNNNTIYTFERGTVSGYELGHDGQTTETLTIDYAPNNANPLLLSDRVMREVIGNINPQGNTAPTLGGTTLLPGFLKYRSEQVALDFSGAGSLPKEEQAFSGGMPQNYYDAAPLENLLNIHEDRNNTLWDLFTNSTQTKPLELRDQTGVIWTPGIFAPTNPVITSWVLDKADDNGLFETYIFEYDLNVQLP